MDITTDRIEKHVALRAPRSRVWQALTDAAQFGVWFKVDLNGQFVAGQPISGRITHPGYEHLVFTVQVERIEPEDYFSFRWHPYGIDPDYDYSVEPTTLVEFTLADNEGGTLLTVVESGFDGIPAARREVAFRMNSSGWAAQMENIRAYVEG